MITEQESLKKQLLESKAEEAYLRLQRDALLEITWLDLPDDPSESTAKWKELFARGWERRELLDDAEAALDNLRTAFRCIIEQCESGTVDAEAIKRARESLQ
jgi:hypothetical protein